MRLLFALILMLLTSGCVAVTPAPADSTEPAAAPNASLTVNEIQFAGNGDTFLERIETELEERGAPDQHGYVEITDTEETLWQGEVLHYGDTALALVQPVNSGGVAAVAVEAQGEIPWDGALADVTPTSREQFARPAPEIRFVRARQRGDGLWNFDVTLAYPDTGWEDYADGWHIATPDGEIFGTRILLHPHVNEQPFTRGLGNVAVPEDVNEVVVRAHSFVSGYGAATVTVPLTQSAESEQYQVVRSE